MLIWVSRYTKCGPNQVLIVSGRKIQLPDGSKVGYRIVKGGGTFVIPVVERADRLSLEIFTIEMPRVRIRMSNGGQVQADAAAQVRIKGDDLSIMRGSQYFLNKSPGDVKQIVQPVLEKHLHAVLGCRSAQSVESNAENCAAEVQTAGAADLDEMGLTIVSFSLRDVHAA
jgi:flotillin